MPNDAFRAIVDSIDYPMMVVTAAHKGERTGCLVGFHTQCSIDPPRWLVCISKANHSYRVAQHAEGLVVHMLRTDQRSLAELFGEETGDEVDKFEQCGWSDGARTAHRSSTAAIGSRARSSIASTSATTRATCWK